MLTVKQLSNRSPYAIFAAGRQEDTRWVAVKGAKMGPRPDWAIYVGDESLPNSRILEEGKKLLDPQKIKEFMQCDDDLLDLYRF